MKDNNVRYFKTSNLYDDCDAIRMKVDYEKGKGYKVDVDPCKVEKYGFSTMFSSDYFKYSCKFPIKALETSRRNKGKELKAIDYMNDNTDKIVKDYCKLCLERGLGEIEVLWEYSHSALNDKINNELQRRISDISQIIQDKTPIENLEVAVCQEIAKCIESKNDTFSPYELGCLIAEENTLNHLFEGWKNNDYSVASMFFDMYKTLDDMVVKLTSNTHFDGTPILKEELDLGYSQS